jgi:hypothetical protein
MNPIEILKKTNTVLIFVLLVATLCTGGYVVMRSRKPVTTVHIAVDSVRINKN